MTTILVIIAVLAGVSAVYSICRSEPMTRTVIEARFYNGNREIALIPDVIGYLSIPSGTTSIAIRTTEVETR